MPWGISLFAFIPILLGVAFLVAGTITRGNSSNWHHAQGVITPSKWGFDLRRGNRYRWQGPDGVARDGKGFSRTWPKPDGTPVAVLYDPANLNRFRLAADLSAGTVFIVLGWVAVGLGVLVLIAMLALWWFLPSFGA